MNIIDIQGAIEELKQKRPVIIFDKYTEDEGDLVFPSEIINIDVIKLMMNKCKGVICQTLTEENIERLELPIFKKKGNSKTGQTNFVYPVDHIDSTTGISCYDRVLIIKSLVDENFDKDKIVIPGHQNLLKISKNGILDRQGHTEASSELVTLAGYCRSATICELIDDDGIPRRLESCLKFSEENNNIKIVFLEDVHNYFLKKNKINITPKITYIKNPYQYLNGKTAIVTGTSSGMGKAIKILLEKHNCKVIGLSRSEGHDITDYVELNKYIDSIENINFLVNCAGYISEFSITNMSLEEWNKHINVNLTSVFNLMKQVIPKLKNQKDSVIVNISSPCANKVRVNWSGYCVTKAALNQLTNVCCEENKDIKIFSVSPSKTDTPMIHSLFKDLDKHKLIKTNDIAKLVINLLANNNLESGTTYNVKLDK